LSVAYATQKKQKAGCARIQQRAALLNMLTKKTPREAAGLFRKALGFGFAVPAARFNLAGSILAAALRTLDGAGCSSAGSTRRGLRPSQ
jgi:hypothetical protein